MRRSWTGASLAAALASCTLDAGHGFATLREGELSVALEIGRARELGPDTLLTDLGYEVRLTRVALEIERVELQELRGGGAGTDVVFDPANPPPGYSLCHGGHCHAADGSLPSYEEVQAAIAGGEATYVPVVQMPVAAALDLLEAESVTLVRFEPTPELPEATLDRVEVVLARWVVEGRVTGGELDAPLELEIDVPIEETLRTTLGERIDRDGPAFLRPRVSVVLDGTLLDGLDFSALARDGHVSIRDSSAEPALTLASALLESELTIEL